MKGEEVIEDHVHIILLQPVKHFFQGVASTLLDVILATHGYWKFIRTPSARILCS